ncbi:unnamed protein product [Didymodactylos carnosus]|uniref:Uncharacterized protein n=1 Tax=Didymodactylos carnosus TaxID=1234261 RepID=A0A8S2F1Q1_9BILA|nr:unnamed protein product [Didymodactylos carnosus]CAF4125428.1 unnamed protein product [Didymodactylos carnosus]
MSKDLNPSKIYDKLLPELVKKENIKEFLFEKISSMCNPYYKSRALYQLAEFYDEKSYELLNESFTLTKSIQEPILKFQVLEKIFDIVHYKEVKHKLFIQQIVDELVLTLDNIKNLYDRIIASIRLSFYGSREFRKRYLTIAIETLIKMNEDDDKIKLIIKLKSLINIYDDLRINLNEIIDSLKNKTHYYFVNSYYGRILFNEKLHTEKLENDHGKMEIEVDSKYIDLQALFLLFGQLNDTKLVTNMTESLDQLWINLFQDTNNQSNIEKILKIGLNTELFLTPQAAIVIDELVRKGKEDIISILFPYIIKPSNEVLPTVQRCICIVEKLYFIGQDVVIMDFILNKVCELTNINDETYFEILESKVISEISVRVEDLSQNNYGQISYIGRCNFYVSTNLNERTLNMLNNISINIVIMENLIKWLIQKMASFKSFDNTMFSLMISDCLLSLVSACVQKEDYLYRKITNSPNFNKNHMIKLLENMLNNHPYFPARGNAFILLSAMDQSDHKVIINAMNTLLDENLVKEYSIIGIPLIHLSPNEFIDDLLESLKTESAIKAYEILKIFTQFALNEKIDVNSKSKIINYLVKEIGELKSKKPVSYYYSIYSNIGK